ncbi:MAG: DUF349 domain-containing protein [Bacteroidales bacterium]|nr:DUF349 domain-containing protein [Muribaculaceae bacterium]MCI6856459.1 DUF349 domain-containing protein [Bacteroidales bacterium]MDY5900053.1 DUF349 domain-containing protein [Candidatus Limisoma sp.]MDY6106292.1 DUF349 domain-containing protein [Candidatus Limisoma sp.]
MESCEKSAPLELESDGKTLESTEQTVVENSEQAEAQVKEPAKTEVVGKSKEELVAALAALIEKPVDEIRDEVNAIKNQFYALRKAEQEVELAEFVDKGNEPAAFAAKPDAEEEKLKDLLNEYKEKKAAQLAAIEAERVANLERKRAILVELSEIAKDVDNVNKFYAKFQQLQQTFKEVGSVPAADDKALWKEFQTVTEQFYDSLKINKQLRDLDFKKNLESKENLCKEAEALADENDVIVAFKKLQELHDKWREIGPVVKELREDLWKRFKEASSAVNKRHQAFFENRKEKEKENEVAKTAICEEAEAIVLAELTTYAKWNDATKQIILMQERWKTLGFASKKVNNELFARFRKTCDEFFAAKAEFFKRMKDESAENLAKKHRLCERAEALKDSTDWKKTADELTAIQKEWKTIGPVPKKSGDAVWKRFIAACDYFFENKNKNTTNVHQEEHANLKAKKAIVEKIKTIDESLSKDEIKNLLKTLVADYQQIGHVPYKEKDKIYEEYRAALNEAYEKFDIKETRARFESFANSVESMSSDKNKLFKERDRLVRIYEAKKNELKTYENNLGFFNVSSKAGGSVLKEMERRIAKAKEDLISLEKKIDLIDEKL